MPRDDEPQTYGEARDAATDAEGRATQAASDAEGRSTQAAYDAEGRAAAAVLAAEGRSALAATESERRLFRIFIVLLIVQFIVMTALGTYFVNRMLDGDKAVVCMLATVDQAEREEREPLCLELAGLGEPVVVADTSG